MTAARIVELAGDMADQQGPEAVTMAALASALGVRQPSLYKHVEGLPAVLAAVGVQAKVELGRALADAAVGRSGAEAITAMCHAYRDYAREHPGRYATTVRAPDPGNPADLAASAQVTEVVLRVLGGCALEGEDLIHRTRALRAGLHGFVSLEAGAGFGLPTSIDDSFAVLVAVLVAGTVSPSTRSGSARARSASTG